jgi:hypothetical protein
VLVIGSPSFISVICAVVVSAGSMLIDDAELIVVLHPYCFIAGFVSGFWISMAYGELGGVGDVLTTLV